MAKCVDELDISFVPLPVEISYEEEEELIYIQLIDVLKINTLPDFLNMSAYYIAKHESICIYFWSHIKIYNIEPNDISEDKNSNEIYEYELYYNDILKIIEPKIALKIIHIKQEKNNANLKDVINYLNY